MEAQRKQVVSGPINLHGTEDARVVLVVVKVIETKKSFAERLDVPKSLNHDVEEAVVFAYFVGGGEIDR